MTAGAVVNEAMVESASKYFSEMRTPAVFIAGAAVSSLFALKLPESEASKRGRAERWVRTMYAWLMFLTFLLTTNTVVISTAAYVTTRNTKAFNPIASSAWELLHREFYYELATTRWSFEVSLLCFLVGILLRMLVEYDAIGTSSTKRRRRMGMAAVLFSGSLITHLMSYLNDQYHGWGNLWDLTREVIRLTIAKGPSWRPLEFLSFALIVAATGCLGLAARTPPM